MRTRPELKRPDAQIYFINFSSAQRGGVLHPHSGFTCAVSQLQVESRGSVRDPLRRPRAAPAIRYNYLATENDRRVMVEGLKIRAHDRAAADRSRLRRERSSSPVPGVTERRDWLAYCREYGDDGVPSDLDLPHGHGGR